MSIEFVFQASPNAAPPTFSCRLRLRYYYCWYTHDQLIARASQPTPNRKSETHEEQKRKSPLAEIHLESRLVATSVPNPSAQHAGNSPQQRSGNSVFLLETFPGAFNAAKTNSKTTADTDPTEIFRKPLRENLDGHLLSSLRCDRRSSLRNQIRYHMNVGYDSRRASA